MKVSVVIVTKNRVFQLRQCLSSLIFQTIPPDEIVIIDNYSTDGTKELVEHFKKVVQFPVIYKVEKKTGYPTVYNRGLQVASHAWVAFIDDDCVADSGWLAAIKRYLSPRHQVVLGESLTQYSDNSYSLATNIFDQWWKKNNLQRNQVVNYEILDNKNIVYSKPFLDKHHIKFDESRVLVLNGAAEDCDLGRQIQLAGGRAVYNPDMIVYHHDPTSLMWFIKKYLVSFAAYLVYERDQLPGHKVTFDQQTSLGQLLHQTQEKYHLNQLKLGYVGLLVTVRVLLSWVLEFITKYTGIRQYFIAWAATL